MERSDYDMLLDLATSAEELATCVQELNAAMPGGLVPGVRERAGKVHDRSFVLRVYLAETLGTFKANARKLKQNRGG